MNTKEEYLKKLELQFREWKFKIDMLENRAAAASADVKAELLREIDLLRGKKAVVKEKWEELLKSGGEVWEVMKDGVEKAANDLKTALDKVMSRFKD